MATPVSIIIPAFNADAFLREAVDSVLGGNIGPDDEIIIVNDASTDGTQSIIDQLASQDKRVKPLAHRVNKGSAAAARNTGIDAANNELIFCLDADNLLKPNSLPKLIDFLQEQNLDAAAFSTISYFVHKPEEISHTWDFSTEMISLADALAGHHWPGHSGNYLYTRQSWKDAKRYNESVGGGIDSWAFAICQLATNARFRCMPGSTYLHRYGHDSAMRRDLKEGRQSLKGLQVLISHLDRFEDESVEYLFSEGRNSWFDKLPERPIRVKGQTQGKTGGQTATPRKRSVVRSVRYRLARLAAGSEFNVS